VETKIKLVSATGIVSIVCGAFGSLAGFILFIVGIVGMADRYYYSVVGGVVIFIISLLVFAVAITQIVIGATLIKKSNELTTNPNACNGLLIGAAVLGFFGGLIGWAAMIMAIIALCMNEGLDTANQNASGWNNANTYGMPQGHGTMGSQYPGQQNQVPTHATQQFVSKTQECEQLMARLKQYKADGVITEEVYKQRVEEIVNKMIAE